MAANDGRIPNEGEYDLYFDTSEGQKKMLVMQVADVNKALGSISYQVDDSYRVVFDKDMKTGVDTSHMTHKPTNTTTRFRREKNVWILDAYVQPEDVPTPFHRHA